MDSISTDTSAVCTKQSLYLTVQELSDKDDLIGTEMIFSIVESICVVLPRQIHRWVDVRVHRG